MPTSAGKKPVVKSAAIKRPPQSPHVFVRLSPVEATPVFDSYWHFAAERQAILMRRARNSPAPWTTDPVLRKHKFTNTYRAADRVSQFLIADVIYRESQQADEIVFRILLFKLFNKIETWTHLLSQFGELTWNEFDARKYAGALSCARAAGTRIYSAAYIMPSGSTSFGFSEKHRNHLALIEHMMKDGVVRRIGRAKSFGAVYEILRSYPTLGPFLAFQIAIDLNYSEVIEFDEMSFVVPGPGAIDGIAKCFRARGGLGDVDLIKLMADRQDYEFESRGLYFERLGNRKLQLIDCQNLFCEIGKYARVVHPDIGGVSDRKRIKQVFRPSTEGIKLWFPPKWKINDMVADQIQKKHA